MSQALPNNNVTIAVPIGDLIDRITILEVKKELFQDSEKLENVSKELDSLRSDMNKSIFNVDNLLIDSLRETNREIYHLMEEIFTRELTNEQYAVVSRKTVELNVLRAKLKRQINSASSSLLTEEKSYFD
jgi:hypothetical protein